jgi:hypothetical protein
MYLTEGLVQGNICRKITTENVCDFFKSVQKVRLFSIFILTYFRQKKCFHVAFNVSPVTAEQIHISCMTLCTLSLFSLFS